MPEPPMTRRSFNHALTGAVLTVSLPPLVGCDNDADSAPHSTRKRAKSRLATAPFIVGPIEAYRQPGVYTDFWAESDVYLVSTGRSLIALAAVCTHLGCTVHWLNEQQAFQCPCHESRFDANGVNQPGAKAKTPLQRCALRLVNDPQTDQTLIEVDPTRLFTADGPPQRHFDHADARLELV